MTLICVILKEESPNQFADTVELFNYGFSNFQKWNVVENEKNYVIDNTSFFDANSDIFGNSKPVLSLNQDDYIVLPNTAVFTDTLSALTYDKANANTVATINYTYNGVSVGNVSVDVAEKTEKEYGFSETTNTVNSGNSTSLSVNELNNSGEKVIFINVVKILLLIVGIAGLIIFIFVSYSIINNYQFSKRRNARLRRKKRRKEHKKTDKFDF